MHTNTTGGPTDRPVRHRRPEDAADQPTTEPSAEVLNAFYTAVRRSCPVDLGYDDTRALAKDLAETAAGLLASAPQPAADTEVQWGVRYRGGHIDEVSSEERAHARVASIAGLVGTPDLVVVKQYVTRTPWEEA